jgi:hypothetical protein
MRGNAAEFAETTQAQNNFTRKRLAALPASRVHLAHDNSEHLSSASAAVRAVGISATVGSAVIAASTAVVSSPSIVAASIEAATVAPTTASVEGASPVAVSPIAVVPRPGSNESSTYEPVRSVVAVRSAGVRIVIVITVTAEGRTTYVSITRAKSNANRNLAMDKAGGDYQDSY